MGTKGVKEVNHAAAQCDPAKAIKKTADVQLKVIRSKRPLYGRNDRQNFAVESTAAVVY